MSQSCIRECLILAQAFKNNRIGALGVQFDRSVWAPYNGRHAFSCWVEFANLQNFVLLRLPLYIDEDRFGFASLKEHWAASSHCGEMNIHETGSLRVQRRLPERPRPDWMLGIPSSHLDSPEWQYGKQPKEWETPWQFAFPDLLKGECSMMLMACPRTDCWAYLSSPSFQRKFSILLGRPPHPFSYRRRRLHTLFQQWNSTWTPFRCKSMFQFCHWRHIQFVPALQPKKRCDRVPECLSSRSTCRDRNWSIALAGIWRLPL